METRNIICRVGYCPLCNASDEPKGGHIFLAHGSTSNAWKVYQAENYGRIGFTPHIYKATYLSSEQITVEIACAMYGCGVSRQPSPPNSWFYFVKPESYRKEIWSVKRWFALVNYKHDPQYEV